MLIRFAPEDLQLFHGASHDANSLHLSADYARTTAYGEPVVFFGVLGTMAAAGCMQERPERVLREAERFVSESLALVSVPMSVFLPALEKKSGWNVIVSSEVCPHTSSAMAALRYREMRGRRSGPLGGGAI